MKQGFVVAFVLCIFLFGCTEKKEVEIEKAAIYFYDVPSDSSGIHFVNDLQDSDDLNIIEYLYYYNGGGVAIGDINNDGLEDIYLTANQSSDRLYLNLGNLKFQDITEKAGIQMDSTWSTGVTMEDINNDGLLDIYVSKVGNYKGLEAHNLLYINRGNVSFDESSSFYGIGFSGLSTQASFFDYDNDGDMDMYLMNHSVHTPRSYGNINLRKEPDMLAGDRFYENKLNEGNPKFMDVTKESGIYSSALGYGLALTTSDINKDGFIDIYVGNDFHENDYLYINQGDKTFIESSANYLNHTSRFTSGVDIADINNDLLPDIFSTDMMPFDSRTLMKSQGEDTDQVSEIKKDFGFGTQYSRNTMQLNRGNNTFSDVALMTGSYATDRSWSVLIQDFDNDSQNDLYITNGIYKRPNDLHYIKYLSNIDFTKYNKSEQNEIERKLIEEMPNTNVPNIVFHNKGNLEFDRLTGASGLKPSYSNGAAYSDLDNDGDLDVVVNNVNQTASLLENKSAMELKNNFVSFSLKGNRTSKNPNGAKLYVFAGEKEFFKELTSTKGFQSSSSHNLHFGLGAIEKIDSVQVQWLDGKTQIKKGLTINEHHIIKRTASSPVAENKNPLEDASAPKVFPFVHMENNYLDYEREPLMPEKLSAEGPALVQADFNGDGLEDIYIGGAKYQSPVLFIQQKNGEYVRDKNSDFNKDILYEDVDATTFDFDNDGDLDLYVMSGGNEKVEGDLYLEDRIYVNDGNAKFRRLKTRLLRSNGGSISSSDFNGDGFDDLFIGNRSIPGGYGLSPFSYILSNNGKGSFEVVQKSRFGMVTDSQWADINNDRLPDLILVGDWMPITILTNQGDSTFTDETKKYGLENTHGMWNCVLVTDIDGNGKNDIIAGNAGLNFKWKASIEKPVKLYLDDFDGDERPDPIIFYDFFGNYIPFASKDKLIEQLPSMKKKFSNYNKFPKIHTIEQLTGKAEKDILETKKIEELRSMAFLNSDEGFKEILFPKEAEISSIEDFYVLQEQDDGGTQLIFIGNYLDYTTELGQSDASSGGVLTFNDAQNFNSFRSLPLPTALNARSLVRLKSGSLLVVSNNDKAYLIDVSKNDGLKPKFGRKAR